LGAGALAFVMVTGASPAARADEPAALFEEGADLLSQARELWVEGTSAFNRGQLERARLLYLSAFRAQHHWQIAGSLGHTECALGRYRDAAEHLAVYLRESRDLPGADPRDRLMLALDLDKARAHIGVLSVGAEPAGAEVLVDGAAVGRAPLADPVFVEPGRHVVEVRTPGAPTITEARELAPGKTAEVRVRLQPVTAPRAAVAVPLRPPPALPPAPNRAVVLGGAATSAVLLGVGVGFTAWSKAAAGERDNYRASCAGAAAQACGHFDDVEQRRWITGNVAAYSFLGAGAAAVATTAYALIVPRLRRPVRVTGSGVALTW
jgi:hypothetical protein